MKDKKRRDGTCKNCGRAIQSSEYYSDVIIHSVSGRLLCPDSKAVAEWSKKKEV
jgi:hypothetical protein